jgi:thioester reductase-like protein
MNKVTVVEGDLTKDHFGLEDSLYNSLASQAEAIVHCGVHTSHLDTYGKGASTRHGIKAVNVDGMYTISQS